MFIYINSIAINQGNHGVMTIANLRYVLLTYGETFKEYVSYNILFSKLYVSI